MITQKINKKEKSNCIEVKSFKLKNFKINKVILLSLIISGLEITIKKGITNERVQNSAIDEIIINKNIPNN